MSSFGTSSPVSASTFRYLMRWPVARFSWLKEIFSLSEVAGYSATGQVTSDRRRKPFQLARGAMNAELQIGYPDSRRTGPGGSDMRQAGQQENRPVARSAPEHGRKRRESLVLQVPRGGFG